MGARLSALFVYTVVSQAVVQFSFDVGTGVPEPSKGGLRQPAAAAVQLAGTALLGIIYRPGLTDHGNLDLARIVHRLLDFLGNLFGEMNGP